jgi:hypothetical protein
MAVRLHHVVSEVAMLPDKRNYLFQIDVLIKIFSHPCRFRASQEKQSRSLQGTTLSLLENYNKKKKYGGRTLLLLVQFVFLILLVINIGHSLRQGQIILPSGEHVCANLEISHESLNIRE